MKEIRIFKAHDSYVLGLRFWDTATWQEIRAILFPEPGVRGVVVSPEESTLAVILEARVQLWSFSEGARQAEIPISTKSISSLAFSRDGRRLAVGGADRKIRIWELIPG